MSQEIGHEEAKDDRFRRIAGNRTQRVLKALRMLGNCSARKTYEYDAKGVAKMFKAIEVELARVKGLFKEQDEFSF